MWQEIVKGWLKSEEIDRSQAWLARKAGCSESYLSLCLGGRLEPTDGFLYGLEAAMGITRNTLVYARRGIDIDEYRRAAPDAEKAAAEARERVLAEGRDE